MLTRLTAWWTGLSPRRRLGWLTAAIGLSVFAADLNCLPNQFVSDDIYLILHNRDLGAWSAVPRFFTDSLLAGAGVPDNRYRPVELLTHFLDVRLWGLDPWGHHLTNILIQTALACVVFRLLVTLVPVGAAAAAALIYCLHPFHTLVVPLISGRADPLVLLFICAALLAFRTRPGLSLTCTLLALGSKETAIVLPPLLLLYDWALGGPVSPRRHAPHWILLGAYVVARTTGLHFVDVARFMDPGDPLAAHYHVRLFTYLSTLPMGLALTVWPAGVHLYRDWPVALSPFEPLVLAGAGVLAGLIALAAVARRRGRRVTAAGLLWFIVATLPTSNLLALTYLRFADHAFLLPGLGLLMALAEQAVLAIRRAPALGRPIRLGATAAVSAFMVLTPAGNAVWRTALTAFGHIAALEPSYGRAQHNYAAALMERGAFEQAIPRFERAIALGYDNIKPRFMLARAYMTVGRDADAMEQLRHAIRLDPAWEPPRRLLELLEQRQSSRSLP